MKAKYFMHFLNVAILMAMMGLWATKGWDPECSSQNRQATRGTEHGPGPDLQFAPLAAASHTSRVPGGSPEIPALPDASDESDSTGRKDNHHEFNDGLMQRHAAGIQVIFTDPDASPAQVYQESNTPLYVFFHIWKTHIS